MTIQIRAAAARPELELARTLVASFFEALKREDLSRLVREGEGDDFPEVQTAATLLEEQSDALRRFRLALTEYADPDFWDDGLPGGSLAQHDAGEMARNVLSGRPHFFHRD